MQTILDFVSGLENLLTRLFVRLVPLCAPIPTAWLLYMAAVNNLGWSNGVAFAGALVVEGLGFSAVSVALTLYQYNQSKRKTDPAGPLWLALLAVSVYFVSALALTVFTKISPGLAAYAAAVFPVITLTGALTWALHVDHDLRLQAIDEQKRKGKRKGNRQADPGETSNRPSGNGKINGELSKLQAGKQAKLDARLDALLDIYRDDPKAGPTEAAREIGVTRQTVYSYLDRLEAAGKIRRNGHGVDVL